MDQGFSGIGRGLRISARRFPSKPALIEVGRLTLTYAELDLGANRLANRLIDDGISKGDHVAVLSENSIEHMLALYAIARTGAVSVALDPKWTPAEITRAISGFDCSLLIADQALANGIEPTAAPKFGIIYYDKSRPACDLLERVAAFSDAEPDVRIADEEVCTLMLTSGTTGFPKGCIRTHRNVEMGCINGALGKGQTSEERELAVVPIYYGSGRGSVIGQIYLGGTVYVMPKFDPERAVDLIGREQITAVAFAPTMCHRILKLPNLERYDFRSLQSLRKAGSPFTLDMAQEMIRRVSPNIYQAYSSTETGAVTLLRPNEQLTKVGSAGRTVWGVEVDMVGSAGRVVEPGEEGEIRVRGPNVCQGYYKNPLEQERAIRNGWFYTGDIGRFDSEGYMFIVGRMKELIKTGSINVAPREIENTILAMDGVEDVAVIGVPDAEWGEAVKAIVVPRERALIDKEAVARHCKAKLAGYKAPKYVEFTDKIERTALGKVTQEFKTRMSTPHREGYES